MRDHKEADSIAEESIRNYKTVTALGAESSMETKYVSLVRAVVYQQHCDFVGLLLHDHSCIQPTQRIPY